MTEEGIEFLTATEVAARIRDRSLSAVEVVRQHMTRIKRLNPAINAVVAINQEAEAEAIRADQALSDGADVGPLHGVPITVKDCIDVAGLPSTRGSKIFAHYIPETDATAVRRLKKAGAIVLGKTNAAEFGLWWETDNLVYGRTVNPWNPTRIAGGSSGGDAAAVAAGLTAIGLGSDLAGSIRVPGHFCGVAGLKATHGAISTHGHWPLHAPRYWHVGPLARSVEDLALAFEVLAGADPRDPYSISVMTPEVVPPADVSRLRIGWNRTGGSHPVRTDIQEAVAAAARTFAEMGCEVEEVSIPALTEENWNDLSRILMGIEGSVIVGRSVKGREDQLHPFIRDRLLVRDVPLVDYIDALDISEQLRIQMSNLFMKFDIFLSPVCAVTAFEHGSTTLHIDGASVDARHVLRAAVPWDITGHPALEVPYCMGSDQMPIGVQLVGRKFQERLMFKGALALQSASRIFGTHPSCAWAELPSR